jgi:hypothetical protein
MLAAPAAASFEAKARALFEAKAKARAHSKNSSSAKSGYGISSIHISSIDASTGTGYKGRHSGELMGVGVSVQEHKAYSSESLATGGTGSKALESCASCWREERASSVHRQDQRATSAPMYEALSY